MTDADMDDLEAFLRTLTDEDALRLWGIG